MSGAEPSRGASTRWIRSAGWLPASLLAVASAVVLVASGTAFRDILVFCVYITFGLAIPGMLWVRLLRGTGAHVSEDVGLGLAFGYCLEIGSYIVARAIGAPMLFLIWPAFTLIAFAAVPRLRRFWRGHGSAAPAWWSWSLAGILGYVLFFSAFEYFAQHHLAGADAPYVDMPFHLSLIGELRHHVPPFVPYVTGVPLAYHWFYYAEAAATSWATGIEPVTLLYRLAGLPAFVVFVTLTAAAARRLTGTRWTGPVAVGVALFGTAALPYPWVTSAVFDSAPLGVTWISPTNLLGLAIFAAVIVATFDILAEDGSRSLRRWALWVVLVGTMAGVKASLEPLLILGLVLVIAGSAVGRRRLHRSATLALVIAVVALGLAAILLFGLSTGGLKIGVDALRSVPFVALTRAGANAVPIALMATGLSVSLVLWAFLWAGAFGLFARRRAALDDARILLLIGICAGALGAVVVFSYPGQSQLYYLKGAAGAFGLVVAAGLKELLPAGVSRRRILALVGGAALAGAVTIVVLGLVQPRTVPTIARVHLRGVLLASILPPLALGIAAALAGALFLWFGRNRAIPRAAIPLLVVAFVMGFSIPAVATLMVSPVNGRQPSGVAIPADGISAARWLRGHSDPSDLVATNMHCFEGAPVDGACDARHFWVSAFAERRMLVEGWAYTPPASAYGVAHGVSVSTVPFWDPGLLRLNDGAFTAPSAESFAALRDRYGVRWLFADLTTASADALGQVADLRDHEGSFAVYELRQP